VEPEDAQVAVSNVVGASVKGALVSPGFVGARVGASVGGSVVGEKDGLGDGLDVVGAKVVLVVTQLATKPE